MHKLTTYLAAGSKGWADWYYDFPLHAKRLCLRDMLDYTSMQHTGRPCQSPPPEVFNGSFSTVPLGPYATVGDEEWKRFEDTEEGELRTNKDIEEAESLQQLLREEQVALLSVCLCVSLPACACINTYRLLSHANCWDFDARKSF